MVTGKFGKTSWSLKILWKWLTAKFDVALSVFVNSSRFERQSYLRWNFLYLSKERLKENLEVFQYQVLTSVTGSERQLDGKAYFSTTLQFSVLNFRLKLCERSYSYRNFKRYQVWRDLGGVKGNKLFPETIIYKVFETNCSFDLK